MGIGIGMEREQCQFVMAGEGFDNIRFHVYSTLLFTSLGQRLTHYISNKVHHQNRPMDYTFKKQFIFGKFLDHSTVLVIMHCWGASFPIFTLYRDKVDYQYVHIA